MKTRAITGFFFIIIMLVSVLTGPYVFTAFYALLSLWCLNEFYRLIAGENSKANRITGLVGGVCVFAGIGLHYVLEIDSKWLLILIPVLTSIFIAELYSFHENPFTNIGYTCLGLVYIIAPFCFFFGLSFIQGNYNYHFPLCFLLLLWSNDTGAYVVGRSLGRSKLFERHSPKKTWEGFIGGVLFTIFIAVVISYFFKDITWRQWVSVAILISCFGTMGDLVESMLKRSNNVKDSGDILPGHGGLLDRFDGLLMAAPMVFGYLYLISN
jgi:phosphatidate cytidylyltransferase